MINSYIKSKSLTKLLHYNYSFRNIAFVAGSFFAVLTCLSIYDQDVFRAEHMLTTIASLGKIYFIISSEIYNSCTNFYCAAESKSLFLNLKYEARKGQWVLVQ